MRSLCRQGSMPTYKLAAHPPTYSPTQPPTPLTPSCSAASWESGPNRTLTVDAAAVRLLGAWGAPLEASPATEQEAAAMATAVANQEAVQTIAAVTAAVVAEASAAAAAVAAEVEQEVEEAAASVPEPSMAETIQVAAALVTAVKKELDAAVKQQQKVVKMSRQGEAAVGAVIAAADAAAAPAAAAPLAAPELVGAGSSGNSTKVRGGWPVSRAMICLPAGRPAAHACCAEAANWLLRCTV
jgi:hypothetical protein